MKRLPVIAIFALVCLAGQPEQPECTKEIQGHFWPDAANSDHEVARRLYQSGELQMCSLTPSKYYTTWKYKWLFVSVNVRDFGKDKHPEAAKPAPESH